MNHDIEYLRYVVELFVVRMFYETAPERLPFVGTLYSAVEYSMHVLRSLLLDLFVINLHL